MRVSQNVRLYSCEINNWRKLLLCRTVARAPTARRQEFSPVQEIRRRRSVSLNMATLMNKWRKEDLLTVIRFLWAQNTESMNIRGKIVAMCRADVMSVQQARKWRRDFVNDEGHGWGPKWPSVHTIHLLESLRRSGMGGQTCMAEAVGPGIQLHTAVFWTFSTNVSATAKCATDGCWNNCPTSRRLTK